MNFRIPFFLKIDVSIKNLSLYRNSIDLNLYLKNLQT